MENGLKSFSGQHALVEQPWPADSLRILVVDDELAQQKVLAAMLTQFGLGCKAVSSAPEALKVLATESIDAVLADLNMPGMSGMELLREVRQRYEHLVFLMVTGLEDVRLGVEAMRRGADDYLIKPVLADSMLLSLERASSKKSIERELENYRKNLEAMVCDRTVRLQNALSQIEESYMQTLDALGAAIDLRDGQTAGHSRRVAFYSIQMLTEMNATASEFKTLVTGAWLHDIGKLATPDAILLKPSSLTEQERITMQDHVIIGYDLVKRIPFLSNAAEIVLTHHERWDGSGYPRGLTGVQIPLCARIFAVADSFDAMTSERPYRRALPMPYARKEIERMSGTQFDPQIVSVFANIPQETLDSIRDNSNSMQIGTTLAVFCKASRHFEDLFANAANAPPREPNPTA